MTTYSVGTASGYNSTITVNGVIYKVATPRNSGTGGYNTFLAIQDNDGTEQGFNTDGTPTSTNQIGDSKTFAIKLGNMPITTIDGVQYFEIRLDLNESNGGTSPYVDLNSLKIYTGGYLSSNGTIVDTTSELESMTLRYDLDAGGDNQIHMYDGSSGSGTDDYVILIPVSSFTGANFATDYFYLYAQFGTVPGQFDAEGGFEEFNLQTAVVLHGTKFNDVNSNEVNDDNANTPATVGGITINLYEDTDKSGTLNAGDVVLQTTTTDASGNYYFYGVAPGATYFIDEASSSSYTQTTGSYETVVVSSTAAVGSTIEVDPIGNHYPVPHISIEKSFVNVTDGPDKGSSTTVIDGALDKANYTIAVTNDGETALTNVILTDALADVGSVVMVDVNNDGKNDGDTDGDGILDQLETWLYTATQTASQGDLDNNGGGDSDLDNSATVVATQVGTSNTVTDTDDAFAPIVRAPAIAITKVFNGWSGGDGDALGDAAGDIANYTIVVTNTGNVTLTNVVVTDPLTGNTYPVGTLAPGQASAPISENYTLTQADLNSNGTAEANSSFSGSIENTATAQSSQTGPASASAVAPIVYDPRIAIDKVFVNVTGGDGDALADAVGDVLNYTVRVTNTGNVTLTGVTVVDPLTGQNISGVTLAPGAHSDYATSYTLTQPDLDKAGNAGPDGDIDNTATADSNETGPVSDSAEVPLVYQPLINLEKYVSVTGINGTYADADVVTGPETSVNAPVFFKITLENTGNMTLSGITISDLLQNYDAGGNPTTTTPINLAAAGFNLYYDANGDGNLDAGETTLVTTLAPGQKAVGIYEQAFVGGQHTNTATVNTTQGATDFDAANYFGIINEGPGVRTPGFWQNLNNGATFWDGDPNNQAHNGPTFPGYDPATGTNGDILYPTDFGKGLLVGDYNRDGFSGDNPNTVAVEGPEDTIFIPYDLALKLVGNDAKGGNDGAFMLGRDVVASWLNFLAGNNIGDGAGSPKHYIDDAIDWLQEFASTANNDTATSATMQMGGAIKSSSAFWKSASGNSVQGHTWDTHHSGAAIHAALDEYNNDGTVNGAFYAGDGDSSTFAFALTQATTMGLFTESLYGLDQDGSLLTNATLIAL